MYLFAPLERHYDKGFGAMGDSFQDAATVLKNQHNRGNLNGHLPICYLFRHSIELFLKGAIIIVHQGLRISYGEEPCTSEPKISDGKKLKSIYAIHDINTLYKYLSRLVLEKKAEIFEVTESSWEFDDDIDSKIKRLTEIDPLSSYFRYPTNKITTFENEKSAFKETSVEAVMALAKKNNEPMKTIKAMLAPGQDTQIFIHDDSFTEEAMSLLSEVAEYISTYHFYLMRTFAGDGLDKNN
ncbi:hypothetical protein GCM10009414_24190 [Tatumella terrea]|uniref:hypothetical protein n=1 Tax=Tatumella terrea TaxID=419007 RepID=UPI0031CFA600